MKTLPALIVALFAVLQSAPSVALSATAKTKTPPNVIFILVDDLRYDAIGALNPKIQTPNIDRLVKGGVLYSNAFVTTSLCSPSRATILTGKSTRNHHVVGNEEPEPDGTVFFPSYLQKAGYRTAMIGKWHMGAGDAPRPGFDYWLSFNGQGVYLPEQGPGGQSLLNINGAHVPQKGYITDELTDYALNWLKSRASDKPFFLYLSHKGVHEDFTPAKRHEGIYSALDVNLPESAADTPANMDGKPRWVQAQRNSWHGVEYPYYGTRSMPQVERNYFETLQAIDDSVGRILDYLKTSGQEKNTVIYFMGDNGFLFGEHGLIDKRNAYEESMRVPLIGYAPGRFQAGKRVSGIVANLDIAPTVLDLAGIKAPSYFEGLSLVPISSGATQNVARDHLIYEYYWEFALPHTPTTFAIRTDRYKYIFYHGVWDVDELYDLAKDPKEMRNLTNDAALSGLKTELRQKLFQELINSNDQRVVPFAAKNRDGRVYRNASGSRPGDFPSEWLRGTDARTPDSVKP